MNPFKVIQGIIDNVFSYSYEKVLLEETIVSIILIKFPVKQKKTGHVFRKSKVAVLASSEASGIIRGNVGTNEGKH